MIPILAAAAAFGGLLRFNGAQPPKSLNAYVDGSSYTSMMFDLVYSKLLSVDDKTTDLAPSLAESWQVSADGRIFTFRIDPRAVWSDGSPVTAADVKWTFDAVMDQKSDTGVWKSTLGFFESPQTPDERTVVFRKKGDSPKDWRDILNCSMFWVLPRHVFVGKDFNRLNFVGAVSGSAYVISRAEPLVETELTRHGRWWCQNLPNWRGQYNFDRILFRYYADNENAFEAFKKGKLDVYPVYTARIYAEETGSEKFRRNWIVRRRVCNQAPIGFQGFAMNMRRKPFDDLRVRKAMAKLVDRKTMNATMMNGAYFLLRSYYPDLYDSDHPCANPDWDYDVDGAKRLLKEAGYGGGFAFSFLSRSSTEDKFLALYDHALRECGIRMSIVRKDFAGWMRDMDTFDYDMTWAAWGSGTVKYPELQWGGAEAARNGSNNITGFSNAEVDRLVAAEKSMSSAAERNDVYRRIDALVVAEVPYVLLWQTDSTRLLYWNKFGMPKSVLSKFDREESVLGYWWYDRDRAEELEESMARNGFLPNVNELVIYEGEGQ